MEAAAAEGQIQSTAEELLNRVAEPEAKATPPKGERSERGEERCWRRKGCREPAEVLAAGLEVEVRELRWCGWGWGIDRRTGGKEGEERKG